MTKQGCTMKLIDKCKWFKKFGEGMKGTLFSIFFLFASTIIMEAGVLKLDLEGCRSAAGNGYHSELVSDTHVEHEAFIMYFCDDAFYTEGNLKSWAELDMVPHRIIFTNTTGSPQDFTFKVGGDYKDTNDNDLVGWDYITELILDEYSTPPEYIDDCKDIISTQGIVISFDESEIYRQVTVANYPDGVTCVAIYNMRLAIGSSNYSGSSLQSRLISVESDVKVGDQTLPVPNVASTTLSKTMTATEAGSRTWTVSKSSGNSTLTFDNTCDQTLPLQKDINITVSWTKGEVTPEGNVTVTTIIQASNTAHRDINISVADTLYNGETALGTLQCPLFTLLANAGNQIVCTHTFSIAAADDMELNDKAIAIYFDPDHPTSVILGTNEATATAFVQGTEGREDENATIKDYEWISGTNLSYSVGSPSIGTFDNYTAGTVTTGDVNWTSGVLSDSGSVTFTKTVYAQPATSTAGSLSDIASLKTGGGSGTDSGTFSVDLSSSALVSLTIVKKMDPAIIPDGETLDFNFTVRNGSDYNETFTLSVNDINSTSSLTISGLEPSQYNVQELPTLGYEPEGSNTRLVDLRLPICEATEEFTNVLADRPTVKVKKITYPTGFEEGWEMTLYKLVDNTWEVEKAITTTDANWATILEQDELLAGTYKIEETPKEGWFEVARANDCSFTYNPGVDGNRSDYECIISNAKYAQIIITKEVEGTNPASPFSFTQDINRSVQLLLNGGESETFENVRFGSYRVTENDPAKDYLLSNLVCAETNGLENTVTDLLLRRATINLEPGETVECTFTNREKGKVNILKLEDGGPTSELWTFTIEGPEGIMQRDTRAGALNFEDAKLVPGTVYTLCEINVHPLWGANWTLNGTPVVPVLTEDNGTVDRCYDFSVGIGETAEFEIDNISPTDTVHLGNYAWYDDNNNGIQDPGEGPVVGLTIELLSENGNSTIDLYGKSRLQANDAGEYDFHVPNGNYRIKFSGLPANYAFSPKNAGNNAAVDSDANFNGVTDVVSVSGTSRFDIDVGIYCKSLGRESRSDSSPALNAVTGTLMILLTLMIGLFFVRRQEQLNGNER